MVQMVMSSNPGLHELATGKPSLSTQQSVPLLNQGSKGMDFVFTSLTLNTHNWQKFNWWGQTSKVNSSKQYSR